MALHRKRVIIESPYAGDIQKNLAYARLALADSIYRGEAPYASHLLYTQILNDDDLEERKLGIELGFVWLKAADLVAFYIDLGMSKGMNACLHNIKTARFRVRYEIRKIQPHVLGSLQKESY